MGQLDDSLISQHLADHQILEAVALVDAAVDGDPVGLDFEQAGIGKGGGAPLEPDDEIDLPILGQESHGNTAGRTPDGALMVSGALCVHDLRSEEHTSELQSLMRNSYAVFCLK